MRVILLAAVLTVLLAGCVAHVTPEGTYLEPLPLSVVVGPPAIIATPHHLRVMPLPPVVVIPKRNYYYYNNLYYYFWDDDWYYSDRDKGPWYRLPKNYYPRHYRYRDRDDHDRDRDRGRDRDWDRDRRGRY